MEKNIKIKVKNGLGEYDVLYPQTKKELVEGLDDALNLKVNAVEGKGLSTNDYTTIEKEKLASIEAGAQINTVNSVAGKTGDVILSKDDVGLNLVENKSSQTIRSEITATNIISALNYTPEDASKKGAPNGYASLDSNGKILIAQLPDANATRVFVVTDSATRLTISDLKIGDRCFETSTGDSYIHDGTDWVLMADADWANVNLQWGNIVDKPTSQVSDIDDAVTKRHDHTNKAIVDKITEGTSNESYDISTFVTKTEMQNAGFGDMLKSTYDKNGDGKVDVAEVAESVDWANVKNIPTEFTPESHTHQADEILESEAKQFVTATEKTSWNAKTNITISAVEPTTQVLNDIWFAEV